MSITSTVAPQGMDRVRTRRLFGLDFIDDVSVDATVERLLGPQPGDEREPVVFTPNVDTVVRLPELEASGVAHRLRNACYILPDGQPIVWASRLLKQPLQSRLAGSDLVPPLWRRIVAEGRSAMVIASCGEVAGALRAEVPSTQRTRRPFPTSSALRRMCSTVLNLTSSSSASRTRSNSCWPSR
jgi:UDP-N-acetyl-D-mannosaminuronic acid transferase (WecB/TagA/CpsF family)